MTRSRCWIPVLLFVAAFALRLLYALEDKPPLTSDMKDYAACAENFLEGRGLIMNERLQAYRPPLYPLLLAGQIRLMGDYPEHAEAGLLFARALQALLGAAVAPMVYLLTAKTGSCFRGSCSPPNAACLLIGALAGAFVVFFESLIFYCGEILTEGWYIPAFTLLAVLVSSITSRSESSSPRFPLFPSLPLLIGVLLGSMALLRPAALFLIPAVMIVVGARTRKIIPTFLPLIFAILVISPWTIRNAVRLKAFVPISTNSGVNLHIGHNPDFGFHRFGYKEDVRRGNLEPVLQVLDYDGPAPDYPMDEVAESRFFTTLALHHVKNRPATTIRNSFLKFAHLFRLSKPWPMKDEGIRLPGLGKVPLLSWTPLFAGLASWGLLLSFFEAKRWRPLHLLMAFHVLSYMIFFGAPRFRAPILPLLCILAAYGIVATYQWGFRRPNRQSTASSSISRKGSL